MEDVVVLPDPVPLPEQVCTSLLWHADFHRTPILSTFLSLSIAGPREKEGETQPKC